MSDISPEKLEEIQKDLTALCDKHGVELKPSQKLEISVFPKPEPETQEVLEAEEVKEEEKKDA